MHHAERLCFHAFPVKNCLTLLGRDRFGAEIQHRGFGTGTGVPLSWETTLLSRNRFGAEIQSRGAETRESTGIFHEYETPLLGRDRFGTQVQSRGARRVRQLHRSVCPPFITTTKTYNPKPETLNAVDFVGKVEKRHLGVDVRIRDLKFSLEARDEFDHPTARSAQI